MLIVIVGILIALQVSNWNQGRLDRARGDSYYLRLQAELIADRRRHGSGTKVLGPGGGVWPCHQLEGANQELIDCPSPISDDEAGKVLATFRASQSLLENLRYWNSTLVISSIVIEGAREEATRLAADVEKARAR